LSGAGVAALLGILWQSRELALLENGDPIRVYGFGTPCVISPNIGNRYVERITSVVMGDDMVPRFSLQSFQRLRDSCISIWAGGELNPETTCVDHEQQLTPPGKILWMHYNTTSLANNEIAHHLQVIECSNGDIIFKDLVVSPSMFTNHLPQHYYMLADR